MSVPILREIRGPAAIITLNRVEKRNAFTPEILDLIAANMTDLPEAVRVIILAGAGPHFCSGLDLSQHKRLGPVESLERARKGHRVFDAIQFCGRPVITIMQGAVIGGGLELACATHIRVAERTAFYQLPEGQRGIFLGGTGTVRISRIIGVDRLTEMMLTGRRFDAETGERLGLSHYLVGPGEGMAKALELAETVAANAPLATYMMVHALSRIHDMPPAAGVFAESLAAALTRLSPEAQAGMEAFLNRNKSGP